MISIQYLVQQPMFQLSVNLQPNADLVQQIHSIINKNQAILYINASEQVLTCVTVTPVGMCCIRTLKDRQVKLVGASFEEFERASEEIEYAFMEGDDGFLVYGDEFAVYYVTKDEKKPVKLELEESLHFRRCGFEFNYPSLVIFGEKTQRSKPQVTELNLETLHFKPVTEPKNYAPEARENFLSLILDGRIYLFAGTNSKAKSCQQMIWVYDLEKGFWFALQMQYPQNQQFHKCQILPLSSSRVLIVSEDGRRGWVLEVHQSRLTEIANFVGIQGRLVCYKGELINYTQKEWKVMNMKINFRKK